MARVHHSELFNTLRKFGLTEKECSIVKKIADTRGKYDDGKFLVICEGESYAVELS